MGISGFHPTGTHKRQPPRASTVASAVLAVSVLAACGGGGAGGTGGDGTSDGAPTWAKSYGGPAREQAAAGAALADGGYVIAGLWNNRGYGGIPFGLSGRGLDGDAWILNLDAFGDVRWQRSYGVRSVIPEGSDEPTYLGVRHANDGGAWLLGRVQSGTGPSPEGSYQEEVFDLVVTRIGPDDEVRWSRSFDSSPFPLFPYFFPDQQSSDADSDSSRNDVWPTPDGGAVVAAEVQALVSVDGHGEVARAVWLLKLDADGVVQWSDFLGADELLGLSPDWGYGFSYARTRGVGPYNVLVRALPHGGAAVSYAVTTGDGNSAWEPRTRVSWVDPGANSGAPRWRADFDDHDEVHAMEVAESAAGGDAHGVLIAGLTDVDDAFGGLEQGVVRLLAPGDGRELWRRDLGERVVGLAKGLCGAGICHYAALVDDGSDTSIVLLDGNSGDVLSTVDLPEERPIGIRTLPSSDLQVRTEDRNDEGILRVFRESTVDAALALREQRPFAFLGGTRDASSGFLSLHNTDDLTRSQELVRVDDQGNRFQPLRVRNELDRRIERASGVLVVGEAAGAGNQGFLLAGGMQVAGGWERTWVLRLDSEGTILWQKRLDDFTFDAVLPPDTFGGAFVRPADRISAAPDGGYLLGGHSADGWGRVLKLDADGAIAWISPPLPPDSHENLHALRAAPDGGAFAAGGDSVLRERLLRPGPPDLAWAAKLDAEGAVQWRTRIAGLSISDLRPSPDGGVLLAGVSQDLGIVALRLAAEGGLQWASSYRLGQSLLSENVRVAPGAAGWVLAATLGDAVEFDEKGRNNVLIFEISDAASDDDARGPGHVRWGRLYGAAWDEVVHGLEALPDGGLLVSAQSDSLGDYTEAWVLRLGPDGRIVDGCNAALGTAVPVQTMFQAELSAYTPPEVPVAPVSVTDTDVLVEVPSDVAVARQCAGTAVTTPGLLADTRALTVNQAGALPGVVTSVPPGIVCGTAGGGTCRAWYEAGTLVTLRVDPGSIEDFQRWGEGCETVSGGFSEICTVRMDAEKVVDVFFAVPSAIERFLRVSMEGAGAGRVTSAPAGVDCTAECVVGFPEGTVVTLTAAADAGSRFAGWRADVDADCEDGEVTMSADHVCVAIFEPDTGTEQFTLTIAVPVPGGFVGSTDGQVACGGTSDSCVVQFAAGAVVGLHAEPLPGADLVFEGWLGDCDSSDSMISLTMDRDFSCAAAFADAPP